MDVPQVSPGSEGQPGDGWFARLSARIGRIGADPRDDEDLRKKKALLVLLAVLILPVSIVWGSSYLAFGSLLGDPAVHLLRISVASLVFFAKTKRFMPFLIVQLLDVMLMTALGRCCRAGSCLPEASALWGFLAPLGALVFLEVRQAIGWFIAFIVAFVILGIVGELFFLGRRRPELVHHHDAGAQRDRHRRRGVHGARVLRPPTQRGAGGVASRAGEVRSAHHERAAEFDRGTTEGCDRLDRRPRRVRHDPVRRPRELHAARAAHVGGRGGRHPRPAVLPLRHARRAARAREDQDDRGRLHGRGGCARSVRRPRDQGRQAGARHARGDRGFGDRRVRRSRAADRHQLRVRSRPG